MDGDKRDDSGRLQQTDIEGARPQMGGSGPKNDVQAMRQGPARKAACLHCKKVEHFVRFCGKKDERGLNAVKQRPEIRPTSQEMMEEAAQQWDTARAANEVNTNKIVLVIILIELSA